MLRVLIHASTPTAERLTTLLASRTDVDCRRSGAQFHTLRQLREWRPHLLVVEAEREAAGLAPFIAEAAAFTLCLAFFWPEDPEVRRSLLRYSPMGILPRNYDRGDVASLLAAVRSEADLPDAGKRAPALRLEVLGMICGLLAAALGFHLPGASAVLAGADHRGYYAVLGLALIAGACLLQVRRPVVAAVQAVLVTAVTLAPTQA
ncbi:hypothetical protein ACFODL_07190 [Phenylobacterium terrae]|uniref:Response regulatory domain-containing protein n=1 Tax=Phenylobacterium terrae TaxID=2665495 RepID=A0ABW4N6W5_9CAUL